MSFELQEYLNVKRTLRFRKDGKFKILLLTDPHGGRDLHPQLKPAIDAMITAAKPDMVLLGGDVISHRIGCETQEELRTYLDLIMEIPEKQGIPWAHVYGNHDDNMGLSNARQQEVYESYSWCVSKRSPEDIHGVSNYVLPVLRSDSDEVAFNIWGVDTHGSLRGMLHEYGLPEDTMFMLPEHFVMSGGSGCPHTDQVLWYYRTSKAIENAFARKIPGMMYQHIPLPEFCLCGRNPQKTLISGVMREPVATSEINTGMFTACLQRGDIKAIFAGHDHLNDFCGTYCGVMLGNCAGINYDCGCFNDQRGGRLIQLDQDDPWRIRTKMLRLRDVMGREAADFKPRENNDGTHGIEIPTGMTGEDDID